MTGLAPSVRAAVELGDVEAACRRLRPWVRETPLLDAPPLRRNGDRLRRLSLKLECLQVTGSFKARGATNRMLTLPRADVEKGLVTASAGNHGLGVAYAGHVAGVPTSVYLPRSASADKVARMRQWGASPVVAGATFDDADRAARAAAEREGRTYLHPFADRQVIAGQGTVALELLAQAPDVDVVVVAVGGGGLIAGVGTVLRALRPQVRLIGVEPTGAPKLHESLRARRLVRLTRVDTRAGTLAPRQCGAINWALAQRCVERVVLVTDGEMQAAAEWLWQECGVAAELGGSAAAAALLAGRVAVPAGARVCAIVCGSGTDGLPRTGAEDAEEGPAAGTVQPADSTRP